MDLSSQPQRIQFKLENPSLLQIHLSENWSLYDAFNPLGLLTQFIHANGNPQAIQVNGKGLGEWDSSLLVFMSELRSYAEKNNCHLDLQDFPEGVLKILNLSQAQAGKSLGYNSKPRLSLLGRLGSMTTDFFEGAYQLLFFMGEAFYSLMRLVRGRAQCRFSDFIVLVQQVGVEALPIVGLISVLVGITMAFVGSVQLQKFGATIYVADAVALAMVREMGAMMTAIIMCGRTGAAFAATLGSMKVTEELDSLRTTGISPVDFLVLPRLIALFLMMPLLCIFSDFIGILGGMFVACTMMDLTFTEYINKTQAAITLTDISTGLIKSVVFGSLVALTGCLRGMQCGDSASAVGDATTSAVVSGITAIIIADAFFAVLFNALGI